MLCKHKTGILSLLAVAFFMVGCQTTPTQQGAMTGALVGAGAGAIIGNQSDGKSGEGALNGAGLGALTGALIGDRVDENRSRRVYGPPASSPPPQAQPSGHWETRTRRTASGETYEERVWVEH